MLERKNRRFIGEGVDYFSSLNSNSNSQTDLGSEPSVESEATQSKIDMKKERFEYASKKYRKDRRERLEQIEKEIEKFNEQDVNVDNAIKTYENLPYHKKADNELIRKIEEDNPLEFDPKEGYSIKESLLLVKRRIYRDRLNLQE